MSVLVIDGPTLPSETAMRLPGDKSIAHRALICAAVADGTSRLGGLPGGADVRATRSALERLGVSIRPAPGGLDVTGRGFAGLDRDGRRPLTLDCGNSGTTARLLAGLLAGRRGVFRLTGDASLSRRPMSRVVEPLRALGARVADLSPAAGARAIPPSSALSAREGGESRLPLTIDGGPLVAPSRVHATTSAQVMSALLIAGLQARGTTRVEALGPLRDHGERMLVAAGMPVVVEPGGSDGTRIVAVRGAVAALRPFAMTLPGDPSSAAFFAALAAATPGARVRFERVSVNPTRLGFFRLLRRMGASVRVHRPGRGDAPEEPSGSIEVRHRSLRGIAVSAAEAADAIDELPLVALLGAVARGGTTIRGAGELRAKESDRLARTAEVLGAFGARVVARADRLETPGGARLRAARLEAGDDHRMAMLAAIAASLAAGRSEIRGAESAAVSFPGFAPALAGAGARVVAA